MTPSLIDARLRAALDAAQRAKRLPAARRALAEATRLSRAVAPKVAAELEAIAPRLNEEGGHSGRPADDPWAVPREVEQLRAEGVTLRKIAQAAIDVGACTGPRSPKTLQACKANLRKQRERWHDAERDRHNGTVTQKRSAPVAASDPGTTVSGGAHTKLNPRPKETPMPKLLKRVTEFYKEDDAPLAKTEEVENDDVEDDLEVEDVEDDLEDEENEDVDDDADEEAEDDEPKKGKVPAHRAPSGSRKGR